ncbi:hypothetical protein BC629DRAFT_1586422 [Irpex lacteus]|nr:hypothetical protein BC629DRAFT_1586422 [Irpex lacteus]
MSTSASHVSVAHGDLDTVTIHRPSTRELRRLPTLPIDLNGVVYAAIVLPILFPASICNLSFGAQPYYKSQRVVRVIEVSSHADYFKDLWVSLLYRLPRSKISSTEPKLATALAIVLPHFNHRRRHSLPFYGDFVAANSSWQHQSSGETICRWRSREGERETVITDQPQALHGHILGRYLLVRYTPRCRPSGTLRKRNTRTTMSETQPGVLVWQFDHTRDAIHTSRATTAKLSNAFDIHLALVPSL